MDAKQPQIEECAISIMALRIGKKQFSKQMFNQVEVVPLCDDSGSCREGIKPWGIVSPDGSETARWLLFEQRGRLYRSLLRPFIRTADAIARDREAVCFGMCGHEPGSYHYEKGLADLRRLETEPIRSQVHVEFNRLPQLFIGV